MRSRSFTCISGMAVFFGRAELKGLAHYLGAARKRKHLHVLGTQGAELLEHCKKDWVEEPPISTLGRRQFGSGRLHAEL